MSDPSTDRPIHKNVDFTKLDTEKPVTDFKDFYNHDAVRPQFYRVPALRHTDPLGLECDGYPPDWDDLDHLHRGEHAVHAFANAASALWDELRATPAPNTMPLDEATMVMDEGFQSILSVRDRTQRSALSVRDSTQRSALDLLDPENPTALRRWINSQLLEARKSFVKRVIEEARKQKEKGEDGSDILRATHHMRATPGQIARIENSLNYGRGVVFSEPVPKYTCLYGDDLARPGDMITAVTITDTVKAKTKMQAESIYHARAVPL